MKTLTDGNGSITITYNNDMTLASEKIPYILNHGMVYDYDNLGRRTSMSLQNVGSALAASAYTYDAMSRLSSVWTAGVLAQPNGSGSPAMSYSYTYNNSDQRSRLTLSDDSYWIYKYDESSVGIPARVSFSSSLNQPVAPKLLCEGGYLQRTVPGTVSVSGSGDETAEVRLQQESIEKMFLAKPPELYTYDPDGNLLSDGRFTYTWDGENRLVGIESNLGIPARVKLAFAYDYMGRRVSKTVYSWVNNAWQVSKAEKYAYDGWNLIAKFNASNALQESYLWGEDLSGSLQGAGGVGGLLAVSGSSGTYIPAYDGNGNIVSYVDSSNSAKVAEYEYDAFGRTIVKAGVKADDMAYRFSTKWLDTETGDYYYYGYRYYNADTGRWLGRDSVEEGGGVNLYGMVGNNAVNNFDLLGAKSFRIVTSTDASSKDMRPVKEINSVNEINLRTSASNISNGYLGPDSNTGPGLYFDDGTDNKPVLWNKGKLVLETGGICRANILVDIYAQGPQVKSGETYYYLQHYPEGSHFLGGGVGFEPIGSVINHEKGHANAFWQKVIPCVKKVVDRIIKNNSSGPFTAAEMNEITSAFTNCSTSKDYIDTSITLANLGTRSYYSPTRFTRTFPTDPTRIGLDKGFVNMFGQDNDITDKWVAK
ncbi:MAG TPA: hypothetical protein DET40_23470 [Lentisphaeria bacterium]|nr:MAG: hypothetical protein A2X45_23685 [Lentisphaerae bacterium GWF2_50_93]HCE46516.1 hypothetical protein [Lentisphaeria bacterium]